MEIRFARVRWLRVILFSSWPARTKARTYSLLRTVGTRAGFVQVQADSSVADPQTKPREQEVAPEKRMNSVLCPVSQVRGGLGRTKPGHGSIGVRQICQFVGVFIAPVCHELEVRGSVRDRSLSRNLMATFSTRGVTATRVSFFLNSRVQYCNLKYKTNAWVSWKFWFFTTNSHSINPNVPTPAHGSLIQTRISIACQINAVFRRVLNVLGLGVAVCLIKLVNSMAN